MDGEHIVVAHHDSKRFQSLPESSLKARSLASKYRLGIHNLLRRLEPTDTTTLDAEEAIVTALLAVGMILLAAVTIMLFF